MVLALAYMKGDSSAFDKMKVDSVRYKENGVKELIIDGLTVCKYARFVKVKIKEIKI